MKKSGIFKSSLAFVTVVLALQTSRAAAEVNYDDPNLLQSEEMSQAFDCRTEWNGASCLKADGHIDHAEISQTMYAILSNSTDSEVQIARRILPMDVRMPAAASTYDSAR